MHFERILVSLLFTVLLVAIRPNIGAEKLSFQINSTDHLFKTDCFERGIKKICFKTFLQPAAGTLNDTSSSNFLNALWRKINSEADRAANSQRRQAVYIPVRREVRAGPYETNFLRYALAVRRLKYHFVGIIVVRQRLASWVWSPSFGIFQYGSLAKNVFIFQNLLCFNVPFGYIVFEYSDVNAFRYLYILNKMVLQFQRKSLKYSLKKENCLKLDRQL